MGKVFRLAILALLSSVAVGQQTPVLHFNIPAFNAPQWDQLLNFNFNLVDQLLSGTATVPALKTTALTVTGNTTMQGLLNMAALTPSSILCTDSSKNLSTTTCPSGGTVTSVGGVAGLFTVSNPTTTPTFTPVTFAAHTFYGNNGSISGLPVQVTIGTGDLPFAYTGTGSLLPTVGIFSGGTGSLICKDAQGNVTTTGCSTAGGGAIVGGPGNGVNQAITQQPSTNLSVNRFANAKFVDAFSGDLNLAVNDCANACVVYVNQNVSQCNISVPANVTIIGYGVSATTVSCATANAPVMTFTGSGVEIYDLTVKHVTNSPTSGGDGIVTTNGADRIKIQNVRVSFNWNGLKLGYLSYGEVNNIIAERNNNDGVLMVTDGVAAHQPQWEFRGGISQQNGANGVEYTNSTNSLQTTCPHFSGWMATFGNQGYGWLMQATGTSGGIADCLFNGVLASQNNNSGIKVDGGTAGGRNTIISNVYAEQAGTFASVQGFSGANATATNTGHGIELLNGTNDNPPLLTSISTWNNSFSGILANAANANIHNVACFKNGVALSGSGQNRACIAIGASNVMVDGVYAKDSANSMINGVYVYNSADTPSVAGLRCDASVGTCLNINTAPAHGFLGSYQGSVAPSGACTNGTIYTRTDSTGGIYVCVNTAWQIITLP